MNIQCSVMQEAKQKKQVVPMTCAYNLGSESGLSGSPADAGIIGNVKLECGQKLTLRKKKRLALIVGTCSMLPSRTPRGTFQ
jgi:hypothetical protein